jgi:hypothetical protein
MGARVQIRLRPDVARIIQNSRQFEQSTSAKPLFTESEMDRLEIGYDGSDDTHTNRLDVFGCELRVSHSRTDPYQTGHSSLEVSIYVPRRVAAQIVELLSAAVFKEES